MNDTTAIVLYMIKTGGENVFPEEVSAVLLKLPGVADAVVVGPLAPAAYTTPVAAPVGASGVVLIECYDGVTADAGVRLINASAR